jgi:hypothetical protein
MLVLERYALALVTHSSPQRGFSPVSPQRGGDIVGKKTVSTQGVEEIEIENGDLSQFFNTLRGGANDDAIESRLPS